MIKIHFEDYSERDIFEAEMKGCMRNLKVEADEKTYSVNVYIIDRLYQDFQTEMQSDGLYITDPNLILVDNITPERIDIFLNYLYKQGFFDKLGELC